MGANCHSALWTNVFCECTQLIGCVFSAAEDGQLTPDELNSLIAHAHRRIEQLEKLLAKHRSAEQQRLNAALSHHADENQMLANERLKQERQKMQAELDMLKQQWVLSVFTTYIMLFNLLVNNSFL